MWAYRLSKADDDLLLWRVSAVRAKVSRQPANFAPTEFQIEHDLKVARDMARALGWDTTLAFEEQCFVLPGPDRALYGFVITQATGGQRYVVSPVPLDYLKDVVDWDAHTSIEEVRAAQTALNGTVVEEKPPLRVGDWSRSRKGNMYTSINGANVTIFPSDRNDTPGFKAIIVSPLNDKRVYSRAFETELEAANYVIQPKNFYALVKEWIGEPYNAADDNPFANINWGDDDDDTP